MSDNRKQIIAHHAIDDMQQCNDMIYLRAMIEQKNTYITALEAELADVTAQRDAWRTTACALEQVPERLKTVESEGE